MKPSIDFKAIIDDINTNDREEKAAVYKILKSFAKLPVAIRKTLIPSIVTVSENEEIKGRKVNLNELSFDMESRPAPRGTLPSLIGVVLLVLGLIGGIVNLPSYLMLREQSIFLRVIWKYTTMTAVFAPLMIIDFATTDSFILSVIAENFPSLIVLTIIETLYTYLVYIAAMQTFVVHTLLLCSISTTFLATWKIARRLPFTRIEYIGIGINVFGAYLCCCEGAYISKSNMIVGNFCALFGSMVFAMYTVYSAPVVREDRFPFFTFMVFSSALVAAYSWLLSWIFNHPVDIFSYEAENGVFGMFADSHVALYGVCGLGLMAGFAFNYGMRRAKDYISPMFVDVCGNFIPFLSQCLAFYMDVQGFPGVWTTYGGAALFIGCTLLAMKNQDQKEMGKVPLIGRPEKDDPVAPASEIDEIIAK